MKRLTRFIFKQYKVMPSWAGGLVVVHLELLGIVGLFTFAGVMNGVWVDHPNWHHYFFNNFLVFLLCFIPVFEIAALLYYKFMVFARQKYQQH